MGWLGRKFQKWAIETQGRELRDFVSKLAALDGGELGLIIASATDHRYRLDRLFNFNLLDPILTLTSDPEAAVKIRQGIGRLQSRGEPFHAAGLMVWLHTLRAVARIELRQDGRDMWRELARGFPYCEDAAEGFYEITGLALQHAGHDIFPLGLTPKPL